MTKTFARGSKRATAVEIIKNAAAGSTVDAILTEISKAIDVDMAGAKSYYAYIVKNGLAAGPALSKAPKAPKAKKEKAVKLGNLIGEALSAKPKAEPSKSIDELKAIKAKNLETMKKVSKIRREDGTVDHWGQRETEADEKAKEDLEFLRENFGSVLKSTYKELAE